MPSLRVSAPTRIDFLGGTLDIWPLHQVLQHKATVNAAIDLRAEVTIKIRSDSQFYIRSLDQAVNFQGSFAELRQIKPDLALAGLIVQGLWHAKLPGLELDLRSTSPKGAGIGGSSSLAIAAAAAVLKARCREDSEPMASPEAILDWVKDMEAKLIFAPTGCQDYWGALNGGINCLRYPHGKIEVTKYSKNFFADLEAQTLIVYSGRSRFSGMNNWQIFKDVFDRRKETIASLEKIGELAELACKAVESKDLAKLLLLCKEEWQVRKELAPEIESPETKKIADAAMQAGALFARVCGAGGGGVMLIALPNPDLAKREIIAKALVYAGAQILPASFTDIGLLYEDFD